MLTVIIYKRGTENVQKRLLKLRDALTSNQLIDDGRQTTRPNVGTRTSILRLWPQCNRTTIHAGRLAATAAEVRLLTALVSVQLMLHRRTHFGAPYILLASDDAAACLLPVRCGRQPMRRRRSLGGFRSAHSTTSCNLVGC